MPKRRLPPPRPPPAALAGAGTGATMSCHDLARRSASVAAPFASANRTPSASESASGRLAPPELSMIARWKRPFASGDAVRLWTACPPADCPAMVMRVGSPPNAGDVLVDPLHGGDLVEQSIVAGRVIRRFLGQLRMREEPEDADAVVEVDDDESLRREPFAVVDRDHSGAFGVRPAIDVDEDGPLFRR